MATREQGHTAKSDILTVHSTPSFATQWLMPRLARFSALEPDIEVRLNAYPPAADLLTQGVDIDIRYGTKRLQPAGTMVLPIPRRPLCRRSAASRTGSSGSSKVATRPIEAHRFRSFLTLSKARRWSPFVAVGATRSQPQARAQGKVESHGYIAGGIA